MTPNPFCLCGTCILVCGICVLWYGFFGYPKFVEGTCMIKGSEDAPLDFTCQTQCAFVFLGCSKMAKFDGVTVWEQSGAKPICKGFYSKDPCQKEGEYWSTQQVAECLFFPVDGSCHVDQGGAGERRMIANAIKIIGVILVLIGCCCTIANFTGFGDARHHFMNMTGQQGYRKAPMEMGQRGAMGYPGHGAMGHRGPMAPEEHEKPEVGFWAGCARACARPGYGYQDKYSTQAPMPQQGARPMGHGPAQSQPPAWASQGGFSGHGGQRGDSYGGRSGHGGHSDPYGGRGGQYMATDARGGMY